MNMVSDSELLRRYAEKGSQEAFTELVRRNLNLVYFVALRRLGNAHAAEDAAQVVFADLARKANKLWRRQVLVSWLYTSVNYTSANVIRNSRRRSAREQKVQIMDELTATHQTEPGWNEVRPILDDAVLRLNELDRVAILQRFFNGKSMSEVGETLNVSPEAARKRVDRALKQLRRQLAERGVKSTAGALSLALVAEGGVVSPAGLSASVAAGSIAGNGIGTAPGGTAHILLTMSTPKTALVAIGAVAAVTLSIFVAETRWRRNAEPFAGATALDASASYVIPTAVPKTPDVPRAVDTGVRHFEATNIPDFYRMVFTGLDLTESETEALQGFLTEKEKIAGDLKARLSNGAGFTNVGAINSEIASANRLIAAVYAQISSLLGDARFAQFRNLESSIPACNTLTAVDRELSASDAQLDKQSSQQLLQLLDPPHPRIEATDPILLTAVRKASGGGFSASIELRTHQGAAISSQTLLDAASFLSPTEIAALNKVKESGKTIH